MELLKKLSLGLFVTVVILLAIIMGGLRLAISNLEYFKPEIEYLLTKNVSKSIVFAGVSGAFNRFNPILRIENVSINLPDKSQPLFVDHFAVEIDFWASLRERAPVILELTGQLEKLELDRDTEGRWWTHEFEIPQGDKETVLPGFGSILELAPRYLKLDLRRLIFKDQMTRATYQFDDVSAQSVNQQNQIHLQLSAALPESLGRGILIKSVIDRERSETYINSSGLQLPAVASLFNQDSKGLQAAAFDGEVWLDMSGYDIVGVSGNLVLKEGLLQTSPERTAVEFDYHSRFNASRTRTGWRIANQVERLSINNESVPGFLTQFDITNGPGKPRVSAWIDRLRIASLPVVAGQWLPRGLNQQIGRGKFQGVLRNVMLDIDLEQPDAFKLGGLAVDISSEAFDDYPGTENLNAAFLLGNSRLSARLYGEAIQLDFGDQFRKPIVLDTLESDVVANRLLSDDLIISVENILTRNQDIGVAGRMWLIVDQDEQPFAYMRAGFVDANVANTRNYLPLKILPNDVREWLEPAIKRGFVPQGDFQFHGRLRDIRELAQEQAGELFVDFELEKGNLFFAPDWLALRNGKGRLQFHNAGFEFDLQQGSYEKLNDVRVRGSIPNFDEAELFLDIDAQAATEDAVRVWLGSPVGEEYRSIISNLHDFGGNTRVNIDLRLPLGDGLPEQQVGVKVEFNDAQAKADIWGLDLTSVNGSLQVTADTMQASDISARFFGDPISIDIDTVKPEGDIVVNARGMVTSRNLLRKLPEQMSQYVSGQSEWQARLEFAGESAPVDRAFLQVRASSDLQNTKISLPAPLAKPSAQSAPFSTELAFYPAQIDFQFDLDSNLRTRGQLLTDDNQEFVLNSIDLAFDRAFEPRQRNGMHIYGAVSEVAVDDWIKVIDDYKSDGPTLLNSVDLGIDRASVFGRSMERVQFDLYRENDRFAGQFKSSLTTGIVEVPLQPGPQDPVLVELEYLRVDKAETESDYSGVSPAKLFDFRFRAEALVYDDMLFNDVFVYGRPVANSMYIDDFGLRRDQIIMTGKAQWDYDPISRTHLSSLTMEAKGPNFGEAIAGLGFGNTLQNGTLDFNGGFTWEAPLLGFNLAILHGDARMKILDGVLNDVEPGGGRFVGLLSLSAIPRRLSLDFSDVLIEGMEFEKINGKFKLEKGILFTRNTRLDGPAAKLKVSGKTDIVNRKYDQVIWVTPKIRQTLPLIGAVAASTTVGWGLLLLQNLFKKSIDDAVEVEYKLTGSWDDPQIELVRAVDENQEDLPNIEK